MSKCKDIESLIVMLYSSRKIYDMILPQGNHGYNLSKEQITILIVLAGCQPISMSDLAEKVCVSPAQLSRSVSAMSEQNLVERISDQHDRRRQLVRFTAQGKEVYELYKKECVQRIKNLLAALPEDEYNNFVNAANTINQIVVKL
jgi:DNA-binding MarR family transcriptional regulator